MSSMLILAALAGSSCRPFLDGGWEGTARCSNDTFPLTAVMNENADGEVDGLVYIEGFLLGFIANLLPSWADNISLTYFDHARTYPISIGG